MATVHRRPEDSGDYWCQPIILAPGNRVIYAGDTIASQNAALADAEPWTEARFLRMDGTTLFVRVNQK
jgi:hypothetical protein